MPAPLAEYVALVKRINPDGQLKLYPGSPLVALELLRQQDRMRLFELHPTDSEILQHNFAGTSQVLIQTATAWCAESLVAAAAAPRAGADRPVL